MQMTKRTKIVIGTVAAALIVGAGVIGTAFAVDRDGDGDSDGSPAAVQTQ
jgi:hypothetical protein